MGIIDKLRSLLGRRSALVRFERNVAGIWTGSLGDLAVATVYRCVRIISDSIAAMPIHYQRRLDNGIFVDCYGWSLYNLLQFQPCESYSPYQFMALTVRRMLTQGVAYWLPVWDKNGHCKELLPVADVQEYEQNYRVVGYDVSDAWLAPEQRRRYNENEIVVLRGATDVDGRKESISDVARRAIELATGADREALNRVKSGGAGRLIITTSLSGGIGGPVDKNINAAADKIEQRLSENFHAAALPSGMDVKNLGESSAAMQLQTIREFTVREICRFFGVPPIYVYSDSSSNYKSAEMASVDFLVNTLEPILRNIESELRRKLIPAQFWGSQRVTFDREGRLALDLDSRARWFKAKQELGLESPNDQRRALNLPPVEGGDQVFRSANLFPINQSIANNNEQTKGE